MSYILEKIIYSIYGWSFTSVLICTVLALLIWTFINFLLLKKISKVINYAMLGVILTAIIFFTITNRTVKQDRMIRLMPFASFVNAGYGAYQSMWLNAFFFLPLGLSLPYLMPEKVKHKVLLALIIAAAFSIAIEIVQLIFRLGLCETDDVIMNTLGAAVGTLSFWINNRLANKKTDLKNKT